MSVLEETILRMLEQLRSQGIQDIVAFSGGSESDLRAENIARESIDVLKEYRTAILTGGTVWGLPNAVSAYARKQELPVIGVYPARGRKYASPSLDFALEVPPRYGESEWGDDSEIFVKLIRGAEIIGGGMGTMIEFARIMKLNETRVKYHSSPIIIAPVTTGLNGFSDALYRLPLKEEVCAYCLPATPFTDGKSAAEYLVEKLALKRQQR